MIEQIETFAVYKRKAIENDQVIFPKKFSLASLELLKRQIGSYEYSTNYDNDPVNPESQQFKPPVRYWTELGINSTHYVTVDLAISEKNNADYTVVMDCARTGSNQILVVEYCRRRMNPSETLEKIFEFIQKYRPLKVGIESVAYQMAMVHLMGEEMKKRKIVVEVEPIRSGGDKFTKIIALQPYWESGNLLLKQGMIELEDELFRFPVGEHDDCIDALAMQLSISEPKSLGKAKSYIPEQWR